MIRWLAENWHHLQQFDPMYAWIPPGLLAAAIITGLLLWPTLRDER